MAEQLAGAPKSIALVDLSYIWKKMWHAQPRDAQPGHAAQSVLDQLAGIRESVEHVIIALDSPPYRRREVYPEYKSHRPSPESEEVAQKKWLLERIEKDGYVVAKAKGYEADDVIFTLAAEYGSWCRDVRIIASDKDLATCISETVRMYVPPMGDKDDEVRGPNAIRNKYGVDPADMPLWLALVGDDSDNIPGVPGIGPKKAAELIANCVDFNGIAKTLATKAEEKAPGKMWENLAAHWEQFRLSLKLTTLEVAPVDAQALLARREPQQLVKDEESTMNGYVDQAQDTKAVKDAEWDPISRAPEGYVAPPIETAAKAPSEPPPKPDALAKTKPAESGVTEDLQPLNIESAWRLARFITEGRLYGKFLKAESVFTVIVKARELGLKVTTALDGFHVIEGRPSPSADMMRALAERHPDCEYFMFVSASDTAATWETKNRRHPKPIQYTYTIEDAKKAGLTSGNWAKRPKDMLTKTAASKLARLAYPGATVGLYCPEEMGDAA